MDCAIASAGGMRFSFEGFDIDLELGQLTVAGNAVALEPRALEMLGYLARHPNRLISKDELLSEVWQARALSDGTVMNAAAKLRKAFGQAPGTSEPIETVRGRGYKLHATPRTAAAPPSDPDTFVGRTQVMQTLDQLLDDALQRQGQLVLLTGDPGIGKTRTLDELAKRARARGFSVWGGAAYDSAGAPAYWPWVEILRAAHSDLSRAMFRHHIAEDTRALALLVPELIESRRGEPSDEGATRFRLFDEVARFLASASAAGPRLIIADDVHWADAGTIEVFVYAARALRKHSVVFALALREHTEQDMRGEQISRLGRQATQLALTGLEVAEVAQLVATLAPVAATDLPAFSARLHQRSQGNPFFARQMLSLLAHTGLPLSAAGLGQIELPRAVQDLLLQRVTTLPTETQSLLRAAAAIGTAFELGVVARVLGLSTELALAALSPALQRTVIVQVESARQRYAFGHVLLRDAIYDTLGPLDRGQLHARLAEVLEDCAVDRDARALAELARHHLLAVPARLLACVRQCERAAHAAREALGYDAAADLLARACDKLASEGGDARVRCELLLQLGNDRFCMGDVRGAWQALQKGAAIAEQLNAPRLLAQFACRLAGWLELGGGDEDEARRLVDCALQWVGGGEPDLRAALLAHRAEMCFELPAAERARLLDEADGLAAQHKTPSTLHELALCRASLRDPTQLTAAGEAVERYRAVARQYARALPTTQRLLHDFAAELSAYVRALTACELDMADGVIERCSALAEQSQVQAVALGVELMRAGRALGDGRLDDVLAGVQRLRDGSSMAGGFALAWVSYALRVVEAQSSLQSLAGLIAKPPQGFEDLRPTQQIHGRVSLARLNVKLGAHQKARALLATISQDQLDRMPVRYGDLGLLCLLAETYDELADMPAAAGLYEKLLPHAERNAVQVALDYDGAVAHFLGVLAARLGERERADQHFERAVVINRALRMPLRAARSQALREKLHA